MSQIQVFGLLNVGTLTKISSSLTLECSLYGRWKADTLTKQKNNVKPLHIFWCQNAAIFAVLKFEHLRWVSKLQNTAIWCRNACNLAINIWV
jgi:hypothetical protein